MIENEYEKFEDLEVTDKRRVWWATTDEIICDWNGKKFTVNLAETSKGSEIHWMAGEDQFTDEERIEIEEYLWSGEADIYIE
tara:strand:+ start:46 stop:291 length:246 start_codon:yes stop_codon:yes gene_type:complete